MSLEDFKKHDSVGMVIKKDDKVLMLYHNKYNLWTIPVGKVNENESYTEAAIRECKEEIGIDVLNLHILKDNCNLEYVLEGHNLKSKAKLFMVDCYSGDILNKELDKHEALTFMTLDDIKELNKNNEITELTKIYLQLYS